jgi:uncharacterized coiled-coil DUF342 family protein
MAKEEQKTGGDDEIKDTTDAIKELVTRCIEIDDSITNLREEKNDMRKEYSKKYGLNLKAISVAVSAVKKDVTGEELSNIIEAIEPIMKH